MSFFSERLYYASKHVTQVSASMVAGLGLPTLGLYGLRQVGVNITSLLNTAVKYPWVASPILAASFWLAGNFGELVAAKAFGHAPIDEYDDYAGHGVKQWAKDKIFYALHYKLEMLCGIALGLEGMAALCAALEAGDALSFFVNFAAAYPYAAVPIIGVGYWFFNNLGEAIGSLAGHPSLGDVIDQDDMRTPLRSVPQTPRGSHPPSGHTTPALQRGGSAAGLPPYQPVGARKSLGFGSSV